MCERILIYCFCLLPVLAFAQPCEQVSTEYTPIADLGKVSFDGYQGGKYPGGENAIPAQHYQEGMLASTMIIPRDSLGKPDSISGEIAFLVLGYSTAAMTGRFFRDMVSMQFPNGDTKVIIGAQGGRDINAMLTSDDKYWKGVDSALMENAITREQVQVIWISTGDILTYTLPFPEQSNIQVEKYALVLQKIKKIYPHAAIVFLSDRPFAGYIGVNGNGPKELAEPSGYYHSWTVKWVIEKQISQQPGFRTSEIPFIDWGPTLWTNGSKGDAYGYTWDCTDAGKGGIHASSKGRMKEAVRLFQYFTAHPYTERIFR